MKRGRYNGKCDIGLCIVTFIRELQRINIDETNSVYHIKIKEKKTFDQWLEQIAIHRNYRQKILEQTSSSVEQKISPQNDVKQRIEETNQPFQTNDRLFYNGLTSVFFRLKTKKRFIRIAFFSRSDFADIQVQLSNLSDILEQIKINTTITTSISSRSMVKK